ncbi:COP9 signalosome complex subunit 2 [Aphelenchoides avenae]|nr:COP9 signalosome complex subunit 2 [Aphelenchus avenae]
MEDEKGSKTVWGFKALKHLVIANIQANDFGAAAGQCGRLVEYSDVVSSAVMEPAIVKITELAQDPKAALMLCQATYNVRKPTMTWMVRCITLLSDVRHTQRPEILAEALENATTLRKMISDEAHVDDATRQSHLLSIDAITAELWYRRQEFEEVYFIYRQLSERSRNSNPEAVAAIYETFAKVLLSPSMNLNLDGTLMDLHSLASYCLKEALGLYPSTDTQAHIRCWQYLTVNQTLSGTSTSSKLAMPDAFKPEIVAVARLAELYTNDHGDQFLVAWEQARAELSDTFLQNFFDECAEAVRAFRDALLKWRHLFKAGSYRECYGALSRVRFDDMVAKEKNRPIRDTRLLAICAAQIETFKAEGRQYSAEASLQNCTAEAYPRAQKVNSQAAAFVCQLAGQNEMRRGRLNFARQQLSRAFPLYADGDQGRRRECATLLAFCNYFQVCRVKSRVEDDVVAFLGPEECEKMQELADALCRADAQGFAQLLTNRDLRLSKFMHDLLTMLSGELTNAMGAMSQALQLRASGKRVGLGKLIKKLNATCSSGPWFDAFRIQIGSLVATLPEAGRKLRQIYEEGRKLDNCDDTEVLALSVMHDLWGHECLRSRRFSSVGRHFEKALRTYASNVTATDFLGASFLAFISLMNGETLVFDEAIARFDQWLSGDAKATLHRFYDAYASEDMAAVEAAVTSLKESNDKLANVAEHYASVLNTTLQLRLFQFATDSSDDEEETIRWAYQDAKSALLSEEPNAIICLQRVLTMEDEKGSKTVWGFKALKHLVIANIQANDFGAAAGQCGRLVEYSDVVSSAVMEPAIVKITELAQDPKAALMLCQATYNVRKPTMTWMVRCITLLSDVRHTQRPEILAEALENATTLRKMISDEAHVDDATRQSHLLSIDAITAELWYRRQEFEEVYFIYRQLSERSRNSNPEAVAAIYETFAKVLLSPSMNLNLDGTLMDLHSLASYCLKEALGLYPSTDTQAHIRCWQYLTVNQTLSGTSTSSKLAMPDAFKPEIVAVARLAELYTNDHGDQFLVAWEQARAELSDTFLQNFFDECAEAVRAFRDALLKWRHLFKAGSYRECYGALSRVRFDDMVAKEKNRPIRDTRLLAICAAQIETFKAEGRQYSAEASLQNCTAEAYPRAQKVNSQAAAFVCQLAGQNEMRRGRLNFARQQLSRAFPLYADGDQGRRRECATLLAFCNYFQVCRVKSRVEDDVVAFLGPEECEKMQELADALCRADAQGFAQLLTNRDLRLSKFMHDLLTMLSGELTNAMGAMSQALQLRASGKRVGLGKLIKKLNATCSSGPWFDAFRIQIGSLVATLPEAGRKLRQIYEEGRKLDNCDDTEVLALSVMHDLWGHECLRSRRFSSVGRHFEKALRTYASNVTATDFLGASFLAFISLMNGETLVFDEAIARFDQWLSGDAKATLHRFYDAYASEDMAAVEAAVTSLKESNDKLANVAEHYASVLNTTLQLRQLGAPHAWNLVFDRLSHRDLHDVQLACRRFRSILRPRLRHAPIGDIVVSSRLAPWRNEWAMQGLALRPYWRATDRAPITTVELVERLEECGSSTIPKLVIRGDAPLDHPHLMEYVARHKVEDLVLETDFSDLAYEPLRRFLYGWKSIDSLTISSSNAADNVCVSDDLLRDAAACGMRTCRSDASALRGSLTGDPGLLAQCQLSQSRGDSAGDLS